MPNEIDLAHSWLMTLCCVVYLLNSLQARLIFHDMHTRQNKRTTAATYTNTNIPHAVHIKHAPSVFWTLNARGIIYIVSRILRIMNEGTNMCDKIHKYRDVLHVTHGDTTRENRGNHFEIRWYFNDHKSNRPNRATPPLQNGEPHRFVGSKDYTYRRLAASSPPAPRIRRHRWRSFDTGNRHHQSGEQRANGAWDRCAECAWYCTSGYLVERRE